MEYWRRKMAREWDDRADKNAPLYIYTDEKFEEEFDEAFFFESGKQDVDQTLAALHVHPKPDWRVLDIGCGIGRLTRRLDQLAGEAIGVDVSAGMVQKAGQFNPDITFQQISGVDLKSFPDNHFDFVFSFIVFQHLPHTSLVMGYLEEIERVLKPNGITVFQMKTSFHPAWKLAYWNWRRPKHHDADRNSNTFVGCHTRVGAIQEKACQLGMVTDMVLYEGTYRTYFRLSKGNPDKIKINLDDLLNS
ncbi:class I SAM-dependent methyltransferase [Gammaproteobacteria bacterium]|nr:class I SAM-dependent methyltransferase [Gammaproteobacteria bacterium]